MSIDDSFQKTCEYVEKNTLKINQSTLLKLYSYYKQATKGDVMGERPGKMDFMGRAKFDGWSSLIGMSAEEAKKNYVRIGKELDFVVFHHEFYGQNGCGDQWEYDLFRTGHCGGGSAACTPCRFKASADIKTEKADVDRDGAW